MNYDKPGKKLLIYYLYYMFTSNYNALDVFVSISWFMFFIDENDHHNDQDFADKLNGRRAIGIKRMGELDEKPFQNACRRKYGKYDYQTKAARLVSSWQGELKKPSWHPFKVVQDKGEDKVLFTRIFTVHNTTIYYCLKRIRM